MPQSPTLHALVEAFANVCDEYLAKARHAEVMLSSDLSDLRAQLKLMPAISVHQAPSADEACSPALTIVAQTAPARGLFGKYIVTKADGSAIDPSADYFVLRLDSDPIARHAARVYARNVTAANPALAKDLQERCDAHGQAALEARSSASKDLPLLMDATEGRR